MNRDDELHPDADVPFGEAGQTGGEGEPVPEVVTPDQWDALEGNQGDRPEFHLDDVAVSSNPDDLLFDSLPADRSRVDGMPDGWLDPPSPPGGVAAAESVVSGVDGDSDESGILHSSRVKIGTGHSGIDSSSDVIPGLSAMDVLSVRSIGGDDADVPLHDDAGDRAEGESPTGHRFEERDAEALKPADAWGEIVADSREDNPAESIGFGAFLGAVDGAGRPLSSDSFHDDSQGLEDVPGESIEVLAAGAAGAPAVAAAAVVPSAGQPAKRGGGLGQLLGVVLGGVLAIPVTLAILIWGLGRDPFQLTRHVPERVSFLLPAKFRPGQRAVARVAPQTTPVLATAGTLDQLPPADLTGAGSTDVDPAAPAVGPEGGDPTPDILPGVEAPFTSSADAVRSADAVAFAAPADGAIAEPSLLGALGSEDAAISIDPQPGPAGSIEATDPSFAAMRWVDLAALEEALSRATKATTAVGHPDVGLDPGARDRALVGWYRALSDVAVELANAERASVDAGLPATAAIDRFKAFRSVLTGVDGEEPSASRLAELTDLGQMWLASERRPSDGAIVVAVLDSSRRVGPWWGGRLTVSGETPATLSFFSRNAPEAAPGDQVIATGVLGDATTIWLVDCAHLPAGILATDPAGDPVDGDHPADADVAPAGALPGDDGF
jgi:hypothetical protein